MKLIVDLLMESASNDNARRRKLLLDNIYKGISGINEDDFSTKSKIIDVHPLIMVQYPIHVGKEI